MYSDMSFNLHKSETSKHIRIKDVSDSSQLLVPGRATAATNIPQGAMTIPINPAQLSGNHDVVQILVKINRLGTIELEDSFKEIWNKNVHWIRGLRLSDDCHSYNIQLTLQPPFSKKNNESRLVLQTVKPIAAGHELMLWFSEEILALVPMVFLTPSNIQGQEKYVCTRCSALYESPNPLKLHIILNCGKQTISDFWNRLSASLNEYNKNTYNIFKKVSEFSFKLNPEFAVNKQKHAIDLSTTNFSQTIKQINSSQKTLNSEILNTSLLDDRISLYKPYSNPLSYRGSAFKPFQKVQIENQTQNINESRQSWQNFTFKQDIYNHTHLLDTAISNNEAQIETLVSSLGKSKEGHICLYCGKCYSRKYGLKIHIRTHTGYKPLKCKYCLRPFGDPSNLNKHVRLHAEGDTPYKCDLCGKILVRRRDLERHLKSRHMSEIHPGRTIIEESTIAIHSVIDEESTTDGTVER